MAYDRWYRGLGSAILFARGVLRVEGWMEPVVLGVGVCMALLAWVGPVPVALARTVPPTGRPELHVSGLRWRVQHVPRAAAIAVGSAFAVLATLWLPVALVSGAMIWLKAEISGQSCPSDANPQCVPRAPDNVPWWWGFLVGSPLAPALVSLGAARVARGCRTDLVADASGVRLGRPRPLRDRAWAWDEIAAIEAKPRWLVIRLVTGDRHPLPVAGTTGLEIAEVAEWLSRRGQTRDLRPDEVSAELQRQLVSLRARAPDA